MRINFHSSWALAVVFTILSCCAAPHRAGIDLAEDRAESPVAPASGTPSRESASPKRNATSGLQAGVSDDNRQFPLFLEFLDKYAGPSGALESRTRERIRFHVVDSASNGLANVEVKILNGQDILETLVTLSDGSATFYPLWTIPESRIHSLRVEVKRGDDDTSFQLAADGPRRITVPVNPARPRPSSLSVDLLFVLDATGSMQTQIDQLKNAISILQMNLSSLPGSPRLRFGLVQYRDRKDDFLVSKIQFTEDATAFSNELSKVRADGGGDQPEDLQSALDTALHGMTWNRDGIRLGFVITDAPPHLDYGQEFTYVAASHLARRNGIKLHAVGCGSLPVAGEVVLRQIAQIAGGKYVFLTKPGESGESEGGAPGAVSHHTGSNWVSERLETALLRLTREEIGNQIADPIPQSLDWFEARPSGTLPSDSVLSELFRLAFKELRDFSCMPLPVTASIAILPTSPADSSLAPIAARLNQILSIELSRSGNIRLVERGNLGDVLREQALQESGIINPNSVSGTGQLLGADFLLASGLHRRAGGSELVLKLLRTSTGELLSATRAKIDKSLLDD